MMLALSLALDLAMLVALAFVSPARGFRLAAALLVLGWVVGHLNALIEAVAFNVVGIGTAAAIAGGSFATFVVLAGLAMLIAWRWPGEAAPPVKLRITPLRLIGVVIAYELLYFGAGALVFPWVAHFYADKAMPSFAMVAALQVPRALIFAAAAWPWLRTGPRAAPLLLGLAFAVFGAIAPLLLDNPFMPPEVRLAHGIETGSSNFVFGVIVAWLLRPRRA